MLIKIFIVLAIGILSIPEDAKAFDMPYPTEIIFEGQASIQWDADQLTEYLRHPKEVVPDAAIGKVTCFSDGGGSVRLLDDFSDIWGHLDYRGKFYLHGEMVKAAGVICDMKWEELYGQDDVGESLPSWYI